MPQCLQGLDSGANLWVIAHHCVSLEATGCALAWILERASLVSQEAHTLGILSMLFDRCDWFRAGKRRALPLSEGDLREFRLTLRGCTVTEVTSADFTKQWAHSAWTWACIYCCNMLYGYGKPCREGNWSAAERRAVKAIGSGVSRLLSHGQAFLPVDPNLDRELRSRKVNYQGEEVGVCHRLTLEQVLPSLPPKGHGGSINALDFVSRHTRELLLHPSRSILEDDGRKLPRMKGIIHADEGEMQLIADELVDRGICQWIRSDDVAVYRGKKVLNGLFGVEKGTKLDNEKPVLRLIMNLVSSNATMRQFTGAVKSLPSITSWMLTVLEEGEELRIWQSDMCNAFYLFRIPDVWLAHLAFNVRRQFWDPIEEAWKESFLACNVLPMGWLSSVAVMQEISERILQFRLAEDSFQLVRHHPVPTWMVGVLQEARSSGRHWWHVYLDNFAAGEIVSPTGDWSQGEQIHQMAELAWREAGVLSSEKKRRSGVLSVEELGANIEGVLHYVGGSPQRFLKLVHATLWTLQQPHLSKKLVQVIAGRWIHVLQFRRPGMSILECTWEYISQKRVKQRIHRLVKRELFMCLCAIPLLHTFLGARVDGRITASDASMKGGAVGVASDLSGSGADYVRASLANELSSGEIPVLVISLFGGIGGSFRSYDLLGLRPMGLVHFDTHGPANRVVEQRWPHAEMYKDVRHFNKELLRDLLGKYLNIEEIHLWAGFPCTDLSSAKAFREGLCGPASSLFYEVLRIWKLLKAEVGHYLKVKRIIENVASMHQNECNTISQELGLDPYFLDPADAIPMHRPRLCWVSEPLEELFEDVVITQEDRWKRVWAEAPYPSTESWMEPGVTWPGGQAGTCLPTAMKAINPHLDQRGLSVVHHLLWSVTQLTITGTPHTNIKINLSSTLQLEIGGLFQPKKKSCSWVLDGNIPRSAFLLALLSSLIKLLMISGIVSWGTPSTCIPSSSLQLPFAVSFFLNPLINT